MDMSLGKLQEIVKDWEVWCATVNRVKKSGTQLSDWARAINLKAGLLSHILSLSPMLANIW